jgi:hypothetical protein
MGIAARAQERDKWPFDPMQPGDHEPQPHKEPQ